MTTKAEEKLAAIERDLFCLIVAKWEDLGRAEWTRNKALALTIDAEIKTLQDFYDKYFTRSRVYSAMMAEAHQRGRVPDDEY